MKPVSLAFLLFFGGLLSFMAPSAQAVPRVKAPVDVTKSTDVQKVHGRHCRIRRGHRSRCRTLRRGRHRHTHSHRSRRHRHTHRGGHHRGRRTYRRRRPRFGIYFY